MKIRTLFPFSFFFSFFPAFSREPNESYFQMNQIRVLGQSIFQIPIVISPENSLSFAFNFSALKFNFNKLWAFFEKFQIVGTSKNFQKKKKQMTVMASDSEESYSSSSHGHRSKSNNKGFSPSTPPPTSVNYRTAKRRKGIPHRAPMGGLIIEY